MTIPRRHNQKAVDRYADAMLTINANFPECVYLDPAPLSLETFRARLRDAVRGVIEYGMTHPTLSKDDIKKWASKFTSKELDGRLVVGGRKQVKHYGVDSSVTYGQVLDASIDVTTTDLSPSDEQYLKCMLILQDGGYLEDLKFPLNLTPLIAAIIDTEDLELSLHKTDKQVFVY